MVYAHQRLGSVVPDFPQLAYVARFGIDHLEAPHLMEIELFAGQRRQKLQRQVQSTAHQGLRRLEIRILEMEYRPIGTNLDALYEIRHQGSLAFHEDRIQLGIGFRFVHIQKHGHIAFQARSPHYFP